ncbi:MAG: rRNA maturation RNase YbeY [Chitinivibrionales bacterium]|nr:rRNA maturation RNase YbeY [Chitinivibrionales bacterium]MBD3357698.1 rRNA maturation RNase YbeY [Chitinivibrionales bacterium]
MSTGAVAIVFHHDYRTLSFPNNRLREVGQRIIVGEQLTCTGIVNVVLCSNYKIRKLNREYRGIDRVTDVLTFEFHDPDLLGEIYISLQRAAVQARKYGFSYAEEVERLFVHGFFHLLGYKHDTIAARLEMEQHEARYCCLDARG